MVNYCFFMMESFRTLIHIIIIWIIFVKGTPVVSCPTNCKCRGKATTCSTGFSSFVTGLDATTEFLGISGSASQQNTISTLRQTDFQSIRNLFSLAVTFSGVHNIEDNAFSYLVHLSRLKLVNNDIRELSANSFNGLSMLTSLDLSGNKNCSFNKTIFTYIGNVEDLNLGDMNIQVLQNGLFDFVPKLKKLWLYMNGITKLPTKVFYPLRALEYLDVSVNQLVTLQTDLKPIFITIRHLKLDENPWKCNCQLFWLRELSGHTINSMPDSREIVCHEPINLKYVPFRTVPDNMFQCVPIKIKNCTNVSQPLEVKKPALLVCVFEGDPEPEVKWTRPDGYEIMGRGTVLGNYEIFKNGTLRISNLSENDNGKWLVSAYNKTTHVDQDIEINVRSLSTPTVAQSFKTSSRFISTTTISTSTTTKKYSTAFESSKSGTSMAFTKARPTFTTECPSSKSTSHSYTLYYQVVLLLVVFCVVAKT